MPKMTENFLENSRKLSKILTELSCVDCDENFCSTAVFEPAFQTENQSEVDNFLDAYQITFIPANTKHPLCHIAAKSSDKGFLLLGKAVLGTNVNEDGDEELQVSVVELSRRKCVRVLVGTPLSQEVAFINGSTLLHQGSKSSATNRVTSKSQNCIDEWRLDNILGIHPVQIDRARYFISLFDHCLANGMANVQVPFWVVVDENNTGTVTHMASLPSGVQSDTIVNHVVVTCNGPYPKTEALPKMNTIQRLHNQNCLGTVVENSSYGYALYDLLGVSHAVEEEDQKSSACVEFAWKDIHSLVQAPPLTSDCVLHVKCLPGTMQLTEFSLTSEVNKLMCFHAMILDSDQQWMHSGSQEVQEVQLRMTKILENIDAEAFSQVIPDSDQSRVSTSSSPAEHISNQEFAPRKDLDFTENLWLILKDSLHFDDLAACLKIAMNALLSGACQIVIHPSNKTHLAMFIRQLLQCETHEQRHQLRLKVEKMFDYEVALKCLVGIGCEKLLRDHTNYFLCEELVTQDQLKYFMDADITLTQKVERVAKLQNVLDLVITTKCILNTGHANLQLLTQSALIYYESHSYNDHPVFSLPLPAYSSTSISAVKSIIANEQPSVWCLALKSKTKKDTVTSIVQLSTESPIHTMPNYLNNETKEDLTMSLTSKAPYYLSYARQTMVPLHSDW